MAVGWRDTPLFQFGFLTMVIQSIAIYIIYSKFYEGKALFKESFTLIFLVVFLNVKNM